MIVLMDQTPIAGIGNEYSDEILFHSGIHPARPLTSLSEDDVDRLYGDMRAVFNKAIPYT